jgi:hypothetical protein
LKPVFRLIGSSHSSDSIYTEVVQLPGIGAFLH